MHSEQLKRKGTTNIAIIFAGGSGIRMRSSAVPKQFLEFHGKPLIIHTLEHFERHREVHGIVVACIAGWVDHLQSLLERFDVKKVRHVVEGGATAQMSIFKGLQAIEDDSGGDVIVLVHDGVRPIIDDEMISRNIQSVKDYGSAVTAYPALETPIVSTSGTTVDKVLDRSVVYVAQAPQSFYLGNLLECHRKAQAKGKLDYIDSCSLYRETHPKVHLVKGGRSNIKVTTPEDYYVFRALSELKQIQDIEGL